MPKRRRLTLATPEEIRALLERAFIGLGWIDGDEADGLDEDDEDDEDDERRDAEYDEHLACMDAVRFCASAAGLTGDASLAPLFAEIADLLEHRDDRPAHVIHAVASGLATMVRRGAKLEPALLALADRREDAIREALAATLPPAAAALPALEKLARDPAAGVRNPARATLAKVREVPWWTGLFASDPLARLRPEEAERARPDLEAAAAVLALPEYKQYGRVGEVAEVVRRLPPPLGVELAEQVLGSVQQAAYRGAAIGAALLDLEGGPDALFRLARRWTAGGDLRLAHSGRHLMGQILGAVPEERRAAACLALGAFVAKAPPGDAHRGYSSPAYLVADAVEGAWPLGADVAPLLELVLASEAPHEGADHKADWAVGELAKPIGKEGAATAAVLDRLVEAFLEGRPGRFRAVPCEDAVEHAPLGVLRAAAERALTGEDDGRATWAVEQLLGRAHDPPRDGSRIEVVARLWADPRTRRLLESHSLRPLVLPQLRAELREGRLGFEHARTTVGIIGELYGGVADTGLTPEAFERLGAVREDPLEGLRDVLVDPAFAGPATPEEWTRYRALRAAAPAGDAWDAGSLVLPEGPWDAEDRAELERGFAAFRAEPDGRLAWALAIALRAKPVAEDEPLFAALRGTDFDDYIRGCHRRFRAALGLPPLGGDADADAAEDEGEAAGEGDWLDEDDDEEEV